MKTCGNCAHFAMDAGAGANGQCRAHPPLAVPVPVQGLTGQPQLGFTSGWPPAQAGQWCGEHVPTPVERR